MPPPTTPTFPSRPTLAAAAAALAVAFGVLPPSAQAASSLATVTLTGEEVGGTASDTSGTASGPRFDGPRAGTPTGMSTAPDGLPRRDPAIAGEPAGPREKSYAITALEIVGFDLALSNYNRAFSGSHDYDVNGATIRHNLEASWVTDNDPFKVNQFGHPYQGATYHTIARSMGLDYWEASAATFAGSVWWEITGEKTTPAINDQVASGIAGSFFGEPLYRMSHLVSDRSGMRSRGRPWISGIAAPATAVNRRLFGPDHYGAVFDDHDPAYYGRFQLGEVHAVKEDFSPKDGFKRDTAMVDFQMDYGLPGKTGYTWHRPFDYFQFQTTLSSANGVENMTSSGLLWGDGYHIGSDFRGLWGVFGAYEYLSPQVYHLSSTSLSLGTAGQWWVSRPAQVALQGTLTGGFGYAAASSTLRDVDSTEYHYGMAPRGAVTLRLIAADRLSVDARARIVSLGSVANRNAGRDDISRLDTSLVWRLWGHHAVGINYVWSHRSAAFDGGTDRRQTLGQVGVFYTLLGAQDLAAVDWRRGED